MICFVHVPRTGGMALTRHVGGRFLDMGRIGPRYDEGVQEELEKECARGRELVALHGLPGEWGGPMFTVLRHPVERMVSHFVYIQQSDIPRNPMNHPTPDFVAYARSHPHARDTMTKILSGVGMHGRLHPIHIGVAIRTLQRMAHVGFTDALQDTGRWLSGQLGRDLGPIPRWNASGPKPILTESELRAARESNTHDLVLYSSALAMFRPKKPHKEDRYAVSREKPRGFPGEIS